MMCASSEGRKALAVFSAIALMTVTGTALAADPAPVAPTAGADIYEHYCSACHDRGGGHPGTQNLAYLYGAEKAALADRDNLTPEFVRTMVRLGRGLMPGFRRSEIDDAQLKLLAGYLSAGPHPTPQPNN